MIELDDLDKKILRILQKDGRAKHVSIAKELGVGHTRVRDRVARLEEAGVITGYRVVLNPAVLGNGIMCIVHLKVDQGFDFEEMITELLQIEEVIEVVNVTGQFDAHVRIWTKDVSHLREILYNKLSLLPAHQSTNSTIVLRRWEKPLGFVED